MKIAVAGVGYVGLSIATLLSQKYEVMAYDIVPEKVDMINKRISPIKDEYIEKYFKEKKLNLKATLDYKEAIKDADFVIISTPTNYDDEKNYLFFLIFLNFDNKFIKSFLNKITFPKTTIIIDIKNVIIPLIVQSK